MTAGETAPEPEPDEDGASELAAAMLRVEQRPREVKRPPVIDWGRVAAAHKRTAAPPPAPSEGHRVPKYAGMRWCDQCAQRRSWPQAETCKDRFCKIAAD